MWSFGALSIRLGNSCARVLASGEVVCRIADIDPGNPLDYQAKLEVGIGPAHSTGIYDKWQLLARDKRPAEDALATSLEEGSGPGSTESIIDHIRNVMSMENSIRAALSSAAVAQVLSRRERSFNLKFQLDEASFTLAALSADFADRQLRIASSGLDGLKNEIGFVVQLIGMERMEPVLGGSASEAIEFSSHVGTQAQLLQEAMKSI